MKTNSKTPVLPSDILSLFLPSGILDYFTVVDSISEDTCFILYLEEQLIIPTEYSQQVIQDFEKTGVVNVVALCDVDMGAKHALRAIDVS